MIVYTKMKTLGSGKTGRRQVKFAKNGLQAIRLAFICDARLFIKVFGREKGTRLVKDTIYSTEPI
jgi:hypothetical protein